MQATAWHKATVDSERRTRLPSSQVARSLAPIYFCFSAIHFSTEVSESGALVIVARTGKKVGGQKNVNDPRRYSQSSCSFPAYPQKCLMVHFFRAQIPQVIYLLLFAKVQQP